MVSLAFPAATACAAAESSGKIDPRAATCPSADHASAGSMFLQRSQTHGATWPWTRPRVKGRKLCKHSWTLRHLVSTTSPVGMCRGMQPS
eukprot:5690716-Pyramimonas_sp.AAC.1